MPHRMDVELTSTRDDETFTWRAAKARQPKGTVSVALLPSDAKVGDVLRVEAEVELDGIRILSVIPSKDKAAPAGIIQVVGSKQPVSGVTTVLAGPENRRRESAFFRDGSERRPREDGRKREGGRVASARAGPPPSEAPPEGDRAARGGRPGADRDKRPAADRDRRPPARRDRPQGDRSAASHPPRTGGTASDAAGERRETSPEGRVAARGPRETRRPERHAPVRKGPFRLEPGSRHRDELMSSLADERRPIAERLAAAAGSLPALRKAIADEKERAKLEGRAFDGGEQILAIAEQLHPDVKAAIWMDRAEAAVSHIEELSLRDLRAIVVAGAPKTEAGRELERTLREGLDKRVAKLRSDWEEHLSQALAEGRVLQALRLSAKPPEPTARFPAGLVEALAAQTGAAMSAETAPDRWLALLGAAAASPVRRQIKPAGLPEDPSGELHKKASEAAGRLPALAPLLGMAMPPPPQPLPGERPLRPHPPRPLRPPRPPAPPPRPSRQGPPVAPDGAESRVSVAAPVEVAPVEVAPVEVAPVEVAPVEVAPVEVTTVDALPVEVTTGEQVPADATAVEEAAVHEAVVDAGHTASVVPDSSEVSAPAEQDEGPAV